VLVDACPNTDHLDATQRGTLSPATWTQNNASVLFYDPEQNGTWELRLDLPRFEKSCNARFIGIITREASKLG
jgi:hypothetical protein